MKNLCVLKNRNAEAEGRSLFSQTKWLLFVLLLGMNQAQALVNLPDQTQHDSTQWVLKFTPGYAGYKPSNPYIGDFNYPDQNVNKWFHEMPSMWNQKIGWETQADHSYADSGWNQNYRYCCETHVNFNAVTLVPVNSEFIANCPAGTVAIGATAVLGKYLYGATVTKDSDGGVFSNQDGVAAYGQAHSYPSSGDTTITPNAGNNPSIPSGTPGVVYLNFDGSVLICAQMETRCSWILGRRIQTPSQHGMFVQKEYNYVNKVEPGTGYHLAKELDQQEGAYSPYSPDDYQFFCQ